MDATMRSYIKSAQNNAYSRRALASDSEAMLPTLAHVPGVEPSRSYSTAVLRLKNRRSVLTPHAALKRPRLLLASPQPRLVHLGGGKVWLEAAE